MAGSQAGKRLAKIESKGDKLTANGFPFTVERRDRSIYFAALRNGDTESFFGAIVTSQPLDQTLTVLRLNQTADATASL